MNTVKDIFDVIQSAATILAIIVGGVWTYLKFIRQRENHPKVIFTLSVDFIGEIKNKWIVELSARIENKGLVRHQIDANSFTFNLRYLSEDDNLDNQEIPATNNKTYQVNFKNEVKLRSDDEECRWLPVDWNYTFVEPGTSQNYSHVISIPKKAKFLLFHSNFKYKDKSLEFHSAEKVVRVPSTGIDEK